MAIFSEITEKECVEERYHAVNSKNNRIALRCEVRSSSAVGELLFNKETLMLADRIALVS